MAAFIPGKLYKVGVKDANETMTMAVLDKEVSPGVWKLQIERNKSGFLVGGHFWRSPEKTVL